MNVMYPNLYQQQMNPYMQGNFNQFQQQNLPKTSLLKVTGIEGAQAYQMASDSQVPLFDANENIMYIKTTDSAGFPTVRKFRFEEIFDNKQSINTSDFISRQEFENFKNEVIEYAKQSISGTNNSTTNIKPANKSSKADNE